MKEHGKIGAKRVVEAILFVIVLALGWRYPYLAYCLFLNVAVGLVGALRRGGRHFPQPGLPSLPTLCRALSEACAER